jgi:hypothetical protein
VYHVLDSGAYVIRREEKNHQVWIVSKNIARDSIWDRDVSILSLYPKKFGYSLGGYSHRERCHAPDRKKSTEERWEIEDNDKEPTGG